MQNKGLLDKLLQGVKKARDELEPSTLTHKKPKLVLKIAPDLNDSQLADIAIAIRENEIDGVIVSNTTTQRPTTLRNRKRRLVGYSPNCLIFFFSIQSRDWWTFRGAYQTNLFKST